MLPESDPNNARSSLILSFVSNFRYVMVLAVVGTFLGSAALLTIGTLEIIIALWESITDWHSGTLKIAMIDAVDTFMVATVMFVIAIGFYQLFINGAVALPPWLQTKSFNQLEHRLASMIIVVLGVSFLTEAFIWEPGIEIVSFGIAIGIVILGISAFLYQEGKGTHNGPPE